MQALVHPLQSLELLVLQQIDFWPSLMDQWEAPVVTRELCLI